jgi:hypothetical protein
MPNLIEDGKIGRPVKGATLIGNDLKLDEGVGTCGKEGQSVPVGGSADLAGGCVDGGRDESGVKRRPWKTGSSFRPAAGFTARSAVRCVTPQSEDDTRQRALSLSQIRGGLSGTSCSILTASFRALFTETIEASS